MSASSPTLELTPSSTHSPRGALSFQGLWLFSPRADAAILTLPLLLMLGAAVSVSLGLVEFPRANGLAIWTAQNILGNGTHVILTFVLFAVHRDVLHAEPKQPRHILWGCIAMLGVGLIFFLGYYANRDAHLYAIGVLFNVLGLHHTLSQHRGFWSLHGLRAFQSGLGHASTKERPLQQMYVPLMLSLVLVRLFFVAESTEAGATPYIDVGQGSLLPHGALAVILLVWLGYFALLFRAVFAVPVASGPKVLYLCAVAFGTGLVLVAPAWGNVVLPGMHGVEYYMISAKMMEPREGDPPNQLKRAWIWPVMVLSMLPLLGLGVVTHIVQGIERGTIVGINHFLLHASTCLGSAIVLAHYFADAFIYRFRIPSIRNVMLRRLGFVAPGTPAPAVAPVPSAAS